MAAAMVMLATGQGSDGVKGRGRGVKEEGRDGGKLWVEEVGGASGRQL